MMVLNKDSASVRRRSADDLSNDFHANGETFVDLMMGKTGGGMKV